MFDKSVVTFVHNHTLAATRPWLVIGKGPTSDFIARVDLDRYNVITLNHACRIAPPAVAHFVDVDALEACLDTLRPLPCRVAMPWHPHIKFKAYAACLDEYRWAGEFGSRLLSYNAATAGKLSRNPMLPTLRLRYFSAVAAFNILIAAGIREIHSLGVDGGTGYGQAFDTKTRLANGRTSFDAQTGEIEAVVKKHKARWTRLCTGL